MFSFFQHYTITSDIEQQSQVLRLLIQLVHLRVNYCLLDSDKIFVTFVLKQLNLIEESQMPGAPLVIPDIFKFLVLLSYEKYHSKAIIDVPKILHLCEGTEVYKASMRLEEKLTDDQATYSVSIYRICCSFLYLTPNEKVV
jgi:hypothetical protein